MIEEEEKLSPFEQEFQRIYDEVVFLYGEYRIDEAARELKNLRNHVNENADENVNLLF